MTSDTSAATTRTVNFGSTVFTGYTPLAGNWDGAGGQKTYRESYVYDGTDILLEFLDLDASGPQPSTLRSRLLHGPVVDQLLAEEYTGREFDKETVLQFNRARYYDASVGRFLNEDPLRFGGGDANLYRYVENDVVNWIDPAGTQQQRAAKSLWGSSEAGQERDFTARKTTPVHSRPLLVPRPRSLTTPGPPTRLSRATG